MRRPHVVLVTVASTLAAACASTTITGPGPEDCAHFVAAGVGVASGVPADQYREYAEACRSIQEAGALRTYQDLNARAGAFFVAVEQRRVERDRRLRDAPSFVGRDLGATLARTADRSDVMRIGAPTARCARGIAHALCATVQDRIESELVRRGWTLVERQRLDRLLRTLADEHAPIYDERTAVELGRLMRMTHLLAIDLSSTANRTVIVHARIIEAESGRIVAAATETYAP